MIEDGWQGRQFEGNRKRLNDIAYRMLGSLAEAEDAVQETWLRQYRAGAQKVENIEGWLTTLLTRICLDKLRARKSRPEGSLNEDVSAFDLGIDGQSNPEEEALRAEDIGIALLVVLDRLAPAERVAFVLHDIFAVSYDEIAEMIDRSSAAARQLASRARRKVQGPPERPSSATSEQFQVIGLFVSALRAGDMQGILSVLDPDVVRIADRKAVQSEEKRIVHGAAEVVKEALTNVKLAALAQKAMIDGEVGILVAERGKLSVAVKCDVTDGKIAKIDVIAEQNRLDNLTISLLPNLMRPGYVWNRAPFKQLPINTSGSV